MENSLSDVKAFQDVNDREHNRVVMGGQEYSYEEYKMAVKAAASTLDAARIGRTTRDINAMNLGLDDSTGMDALDSMLYDINEVKQRRYVNPSDLSAKMNKET